MVSSFDIITNIKVGQKNAEEFNEISDIITNKENEKTTKEFNEISEDIKSKVPAYFDSSNFDDLDQFLSRKNLSNSIWLHSNWRFRKNYNGEYLLIDISEKFHGAISYLHYFIETFFEPRGIKLNGTIVGVNTEMPIAYVYNIINNTILLNEIATRNVISSLVTCYNDELLHDSFSIREFTRAVFDKYKI